MGQQLIAMDEENLCVMVAYGSGKRMIFTAGEFDLGRIELN